MYSPEEWANRRYQIWYKDYTRKRRKRKNVLLPGLFKTQADAGRHVAYCIRKGLYPTGQFAIIPVQADPEAPGLWGGVYVFA